MWAWVSRVYFDGEEPILFTFQGSFEQAFNSVAATGTAVVALAIDWPAAQRFVYLAAG